MNLDKSVFKSAIDQWGRDSQLACAMEECGELISAISKYFFRDRCPITDVAQEIADVEIICGLLRTMVGDGLVDYYKDQKFERLRKRVANGHHSKDNS